SADSGTIDLNLGFLYFEDVNFNGILDAGEDQNGNGILDSPPATPEDTNQNGVIDAGEDRNGNGILDSPFDNGNEIVANAGGGVIFDLSGTATGQINAVGNAILGTGGGILDFTIIGGTDTSTMPFDLINASTQGIDITSFDWNLGSVGLLVDSTTVPFAPVNGTETTTGLQMVNGGSSTASVPNFATRVDLVFNSFNPINNLLDTGEDLNANGILDAGEDLPDTFSFNLDVDFANGTDPVLATDLLGTRVGVIFSTGQQITGRLQADPLIPANAIFVPETTNLAPTNGVDISAADNATLSSSFLFANQINNFSGNGLSAIASGAGNIENLIVRSNTLTGNFGIGASFQTSTTTTAQLTASLFENNLSANTLGGITAMANGGTLTLNDVERNNLNSGGSGIQLTSTQGGDLSARITENQVSGSMIMNGSTGHGVEVTADAATVTLLELADNLINSNAGDGVTIQALNGGTLFVPTSEDVNGNGILDAGEDVSEDTNSNGILDPGEDLNTDGVLNAGNGNGRLDRGITNNSISNNIGNSFTVNATAASTIAPSSVTLGTVSNNQLLANSVGTGGFMLNGVNSVINASFTSNTVIGNPVGNPTAGPGFLLTSSGGSFDVNVGGPNVADGNVFSQLAGAGIAFRFSSGSGALSVQNNQITAVSGAVAAIGSGQGMILGLSSDAILTRSEISNNIFGDFNNAQLGLSGSGLTIFTNDESSIQDLLIAGNMIGNTGTTAPVVSLPPMATTQPNFVDIAAIRIDVGGNSSVDVVNPRVGDTRAITIDGNIVRNNGAVGSFVDGLQISGTGGSTDTHDFDVRNNEFSGNSGEGVHLHAQGDAIMLTDMTANLIENNALNGVSLEGLELLGGDLESQGGTWVQNVIRNNALSGIDILGVSGDINALIIGQNGSNPFTGMSFGNEITGNTLDGIRISAGGNVQINNNLISGNGEDGIDIGSVGVGFRTALIQNNQVTNNARTGLELDNTSTMTVVALGNSFSGNGGRGVDILNRGSGTANIRFGDGTFEGMNRIVSNAMEGFYVVNTASFTQIQDPTSTALDATGAVISTPDMVLDVNRNEVSSNNTANTASLFPGGGFSLLVGTSGSRTGTFGATDVADTTGDVNGDGSGRGETVGVGANNALFGNGRVNARVINNTFEGNFGDDVYMQSFVSTVNPITGGVWDAMMFAPAPTYETDPLARLNLVFRSNVGNSLNITNAAATYTDADPVFKSRLATAMPPGPFTTATQDGTGRNAQRTQARTDGFGRSLSPATGPDNGRYQYPGQGVSTFRVEGNFDVSGFQTGDGFTIDNGIFDTGAAWGVAAPGTFQFDDPFFGIAP
ncbi:MAG: right-handed parallel beta-helix repeat-containing protein, partial [Planctomycetota bacterium]|nr:right-handed parallel beta-helix repeat-containing protein [Planctomycetota bacterium]